MSVITAALGFTGFRAAIENESLDELLERRRHYEASLELLVLTPKPPPWPPIPASPSK